MPEYHSSLGPELRGHDLVVELEDGVEGEGDGEAAQHGEHQDSDVVVQDLGWHYVFCSRFLAL